MLGKLHSQITEKYTDEHLKELEQADCLPVGGAFPIFAGDELCAIVMVSGLHHGFDHQVIVDARCALLDCEAPAFHGTMI